MSALHGFNVTQHVRRWVTNRHIQDSAPLKVLVGEACWVDYKSHVVGFSLTKQFAIQVVGPQFVHSNNACPIPFWLTQISYDSFYLYNIN